MKEPIPTASKLWQDINQGALRESNLEDINSFKSSSQNFRLALFDPETNGVRYLKTLIYNLCTNIGEDDWRRLKAIQNRHIGSPIAIKFKGETVDLDYIQAVLEVGFVARHIDLERCSVIEIGAGYGRTCHAILANCGVGSYCIVDLPNALKLARTYLRAVLDEEAFGRLRFIEAEDFHSLRGELFDLAINIDSFAEMDPDVVGIYLDYIANSAKLFYVKNTVGKYVDNSVDSNDPSVRAALSTGILRDIIDIYNQTGVEEAVPRFLEAYRPGQGWTCLDDSWPPPWTYYWQALYRRWDDD